MLWPCSFFCGVWYFAQARWHYRTSRQNSSGSDCRTLTLFSPSLPPCECPLAFETANRGSSSQKALLHCQKSLSELYQNSFLAAFSPRQLASLNLCLPIWLFVGSSHLLHSIALAQLPSSSSPFGLYLSSLPNTLPGQNVCVWQRRKGFLC